MRICCLFMALAFFSCAEKKDEPTPIIVEKLTPAPQASLVVPLHSGWNPLLRGECPTIRLSHFLEAEHWYSKQAWLVGDYLVFWIGSSAAQEIGFVFNLKTGDWQPLSAVDAPGLTTWGGDVDSVPPPPPPPPPPGPYLYEGSYVVNGRIVFLDNYWSSTKRMMMFDPALNQWIPINLEGMPSLNWAIVFSTEDEIIVWNYDGSKGYGARFNPLKNTWTQMSQVNAPNFPLDFFDLYPSPKLWVDGHFVLWNGHEGSMYQPSTDTWAPMNTKGGPQDPNVVRVNDKLFASDTKRAAFFEPKENQWLQIKKPKYPKPSGKFSGFCGCGAFPYNHFRFYGGQLYTENKIYDEEKKEWLPKEIEEDKHELVESRFSSADVEAYKKELEEWVASHEVHKDQYFLLEFTPKYDQAKKFKELELAQIWVFLAPTSAPE